MDPATVASFKGATLGGTGIRLQGPDDKGARLLRTSGDNVIGTEPGLVRSFEPKCVLGGTETGPASMEKLPTLLTYQPSRHQVHSESLENLYKRSILYTSWSFSTY